VASLTITGTGTFTHRVAVGVLRKAANDLQVVQKQQVAQAFRISGQPSRKWPPLWADKFLGAVPEKIAGAITNAESEFFKATNAKKLDAARIAKAGDRLRKAQERAYNAASYRRGGNPLLDTGRLRASFFTKYNFVFEAEKAAVVVIASSAFYAKWHQTGFKTKGPNFIPLSLKAKREHERGVNPAHEGLEYGVDYVMAWRGVKVPARPMIDYADPVNKLEIEGTIKLHIN
jgi:phage gpG-like protein